MGKNRFEHASSEVSLCRVKQGGHRFGLDSRPSDGTTMLTFQATITDRKPKSHIEILCIFMSRSWKNKNLEPGVWMIQLPVCQGDLKSSIVHALFASVCLFVTYVFWPEKPDYIFETRPNILVSFKSKTRFEITWFGPCRSWSTANRPGQSSLPSQFKG